MNYPWRADKEQNVTFLKDANQEMELQNGMVFAVPIPAEHAADGRNIAKAIGTAIKEARYGAVA
jgi:pseudouridine-5'-phosphate glycosidase